jgi:hypothetical protein
MEALLGIGCLAVLAFLSMAVSLHGYSRKRRF